MANSGRRLTNKQRKAITALLSTRTVEQAAERAGVGARTLTRWLAEDTDFQHELAAAEGQAIDRATRQLVSLQDAAIATFAQVLSNQTTSASVRLRAASAILDYLLKLRELRNVESRLAALEERLNAQQS